KTSNDKNKKSLENAFTIKSSNQFSFFFEKFMFFVNMIAQINCLLLFVVCSLKKNKGDKSMNNLLAKIFNSNNCKKKLPDQKKGPSNKKQKEIKHHNLDWLNAFIFTFQNKSAAILLFAKRSFFCYIFLIHANKKI
ncbi:hypothetical protein RFI_31796, partial [Reticulomyxa filosa]